MVVVHVREGALYKTFFKTLYLFLFLDFHGFTQNISCFDRSFFTFTFSSIFIWRMLAGHVSKISLPHSRHSSIYHSLTGISLKLFSCFSKKTTNIEATSPVIFKYLFAMFISIKYESYFWKRERCKSIYLTYWAKSEVDVSQTIERNI